MAKMKCECHNYGECDIADNHEILEVESTEKECPECHKPLFPVKVTTPPWWKIHQKQLMLGGGVIAVLAIVVVILGLAGVFGGKKAEKPNTQLTQTGTEQPVDTPAVAPEEPAEPEPDPEPVMVETISINEPAATLTVGATQKFTCAAAPEENDETITWTSSDESVATVDAQTGEVKAVKEGSASIMAKTDQSNKSASVMVTVKKKAEPKPKTGGVDLGYGIYDGPTNSAGQPHGSGTIRYYAAHKIVESKDYVAQRGESVTGTFRDGKLQTGQWYKNDGTQQRVNR